MNVTASSRKKARRTNKTKAMATAKQAVREILDGIADDASFEDIQYHIYVRQKIEKAMEDMNAGRVLTEEEAERRMAGWFEH